MSQTQEQQQVNFSINEMIMIQLRDLKENQRELKAELKDVRQEIKETRKELDEIRKEFNGRIDRLTNKIDSSSNHGSKGGILNGRTFIERTNPLGGKFFLQRICF